MNHLSLKCLSLEMPHFCGNYLRKDKSFENKNWGNGGKFFKVFYNFKLKKKIVSFCRYTM